MSWALSPTATAPVMALSYFQGRRHEVPALSISLNNLARFWNPVATTRYCETDWSSAPGNDYIPRKIRHAADAIKAIDGFSLPAPIKAAANRAARSLTDVLIPAMRRSPLRRQPSGVFDTPSFLVDLPQILGGEPPLQQNWYHTMPAHRRTLPHVALVASADALSMWQDPDYIPRVAAACIAIYTACSAMGIPCTAALVSHYHAQEPGFLSPMIIARPGQSPNHTTLGVLMHRDLMRHAEMTAWASHPLTRKTILALYGIPATDYRDAEYYQLTITAHGGEAVAWAKAQGASTVIAIGNIKDGPKADAHLDGAVAIQDVVDIVREQLLKTINKAA